jgi:hypothetical protein
MNERDIARIEKVTNCTLPRGYRKLLLSFPPELKAVLGLEPRDARLLFTDTATIIKWNKFFSVHLNTKTLTGRFARSPQITS